ncbi:Holliday junction resolvase RecU [Anaeropeptidivorans aminofermentans]|jgi:recombination protein U|uniref:Holliday junction resolvase RecU n=1 Tax=Anaeropeptidivorans aminofermentans TaxID=2934315 RepID=UPI0020249B21|nr:Holliday junction resolvase RecU [Anaeropeptidivorans aminofermentans]MBE6012909.1 Holliday junction resolvase RecU [Lachnospiraceae bacterium]
MGYFKTRGLRGSTFEEMINLTNEVYLKKNLAIIQKIPTPITPVNMDKSKNTITLAYFEKKSTVDYIGAVQGIPICFDAKETNRKSLPMQNIHSHQIEFMENFEKQKGIAFFLVNFTLYDRIFYLPFRELKFYWDTAVKGGRKSIPYEAFHEDFIIQNKNGAYVHYLEGINRDIIIKEGL